VENRVLRPPAQTARRLGGSMFSGIRAPIWANPKGPAAAHAAAHHHVFVIICLLTIFALLAIV